MQHDILWSKWRYFVSIDLNHTHTRFTRSTCLKTIQYHWPLWEPTSQGSAHLQTQLQDGCFLFSFYLPRCTLQDFPSVSSLASLPFIILLSSNNNIRIIKFLTLTVSEIYVKKSQIIAKISIISSVWIEFMIATLSRLFSNFDKWQFMPHISWLCIPKFPSTSPLLPHYIPPPLYPCPHSYIYRRGGAPTSIHAPTYVYIHIYIYILCTSTGQTLAWWHKWRNCCYCG